MRFVVALAAGVLFGLGLAVSRMVSPAKVLGFLDVAGRWDPSLALVMAGALIVTVPAFSPTLRLAKPVCADRFDVPTKSAIDGRLVGGATIFGVGWGLVGFCPGPAIASLGYGRVETLVFLAATIVGMLLFRLVPGPVAPRRPAAASG